MAALQGFLTYDPARGLDSIGVEFLHDVELLSRKIYRQYHLKVSFDDYHGSVVEHICKALANFNPDLGSISNFIYRIVATCAGDLHKGMLRETFESAEDMLVVTQPSENPGTVKISRDLDIAFRKGLMFMAKEFYDRKIWINQDRIYLDFISGNSTPIVNAVLWRYVLDPAEYTPQDGSECSVIQMIASDLGLDDNVVLSLYAVLNEDLFFILDILRGVRLSVPRTFNVSKSSPS